jgi:hypothetical protein
VPGHGLGYGVVPRRPGRLVSDKKREADLAMAEAHKNAYGDHEAREKAVREYRKSRGEEK